MINNEIYWILYRNLILGFTPGALNQAKEVKPIKTDLLQSTADSPRRCRKTSDFDIVFGRQGGELLHGVS